MKMAKITVALALLAAVAALAVIYQNHNLAAPILTALSVNLLAAAAGLALLNLASDCWSLASAIIVAFLARIFIVSGSAAIIMKCCPAGKIEFLAWLVAIYSLVLASETCIAIKKISATEFPANCIARYHDDT